MVSDILDEPLEGIDGFLIKRFLCHTEKDYEGRLTCVSVSGDVVNCPSFNWLFGTFMDLISEESTQISPQRLNAIIEHGS